MFHEITLGNKKDKWVDAYRINSHYEVVDCMRPNLLGNPFQLGQENQRQECLANFKKYLWEQMLSDTPIRRELKRLAFLTNDKCIVLVCCCKPKACHTDILKAAIEWIRYNHKDPRIN